MEWKTRVTELLGCKYPILQGALAGIGNWKFAAAVANAGAFGMLTATISRTSERLREDIRKCRDAIRGCLNASATSSSVPAVTYPGLAQIPRRVLQDKVHSPRMTTHHV